MAKIFLAVILAATTVQIWTHPVLVGLERYAAERERNYRGPLAGVAEEKANSIELTVVDDLDPEQFREALDGDLSCDAAVAWICRNRTNVSQVNPANQQTWRRGNSRFCAARCKANSDFYAFVIIVGQPPEVP